MISNILVRKMGIRRYNRLVDRVNFVIKVAFVISFAAFLIVYGIIIIGGVTR